jgi:valyl-tRNA synthetase
MQPELRCIGDGNVTDLVDQHKSMTLMNRYILSRLATTVKKCHDGFEGLRLFESTDALRRFIVEDVCDVYVEFTKVALNRPDLEEYEKVFLDLSMI